MKIPRSALKILLYLGYAVIFTVVLLHVLGYRLIIPDGATEPNWNAVQAISTIIFSILTFGLTFYIAIRQEKLTLSIASKELQSKQMDLKIQLFDKRFKIYQRFKEYPIDLVEIFARLGKNSLTDPWTGVDLLNIIIFKHSETKELNALKEKQDLTNDEKATKEFLEFRISIENGETARSEIAFFEQAKFCFPPALAHMLISFIKSMFSFALSNLKNEEEFEKIQNNLLQSIDGIKSNNLDEKLEECLRLSYDDII